MFEAFDTPNSNDDFDASRNSGSSNGLPKPQEPKPTPKPKRSPTEATKRSSQETRTLNHLLTAAGFKGSIRGFITAVWGVSEGTDVFSACHAQVGTHGHDDRSVEAAKAYVRYYLERLEPIQAQLGVWFIRADVGGIDPETGEHITTHYDCSLLYDAINAMAAPEAHHHKASVRAQRIVDQLRVESVLVEENDDTADDTALQGEPIKVLKAMAVKRGWLIKAARLAGDDPAEWLRREIEQAQKVLDRLEGERLHTLKKDHRRGEEGERIEAPTFAENEEIGPSLLGERVRKPHPLTALVDLQNFAQWVAWDYLERTNAKGEIKLTKPPINPHTGKLADVQNPATWGTYQEAIQHGGKVGFVLAETDPFAGIDIDHCINEAGEIEGWAQDVISGLNSYAERSPSGTGVRIFVGGKLPGKGVNRQVEGHKIEVYDRARYLTFTGDHIEGTPQTIEYRQEELTALYTRIVGVQEAPIAQEKLEISPPPSSCVHSEAPTQSLTDEDEKVIELAHGFRSGRKFQRLWKGDASAYKSTSEAELELCALLAFITQDSEQIGRIVAHSKLRGAGDEKWNRPDYRNRTIQTALAGLKATYRNRAHR